VRRDLLLGLRLDHIPGLEEGLGGLYAISRLALVQCGMVCRCMISKVEHLS
jgi:hypothetical protein